MMWFSAEPAPHTSARTGFATSTDGVHWTKHPENPVLTSGTGWEMGHVHQVSVIKDNGIYKMWYSGAQGSPHGPHRIGFATSTDGIHWTKYEGNPVLNLGLSGSWDANTVTNPSVIKDGDLYKMWYHGKSTSGVHHFGYATSSDGLHWTKHVGNPVLSTGSPGEPDSESFTEPAVIKDQGLYRMWYRGYDGNHATICYASSTDGISWTKYPNNPVIKKEGTVAAGPTVIKEDGTYKMWYGSHDERSIGFANIISYAYSGPMSDVTSPVVDAGYDQTVDEDTLVTLDGSGSSDNVGITSYTWTFTDVIAKTLTGEKPTYVFQTPGTYTVTLNVTDAAGNWATDEVVITVLDVTPPVAIQTVKVNTPVNFDATGSSDNVGVVSYEWDFGDGKTGTGVTTTHTYTQTGTYTVTSTVTDAAGNSATDTIHITVVGEEPESPTGMFDIWMIVAIGAIIIAVAEAVYLLVGRKPS